MPESRSIVSRKTSSSGLLRERKVASAVKALRFGRSSDPEEPATREARRGTLARSLSLFLSFALLLFLSSLAISLPPLLPSSLSSACSLLLASWSYGINCSSRRSLSCGRSLEPYFKNSFIPSPSRSSLLCFLLFFFCFALVRGRKGRD